jgi:dTDP-4-amino-4,6-dideoxygalactose transaminase
MITFNKIYLTGHEFENIQEALKIERLSGNGYFTKHCHQFFEKKYGFKKTLLTNSATAALEMAALLIDVKPGDEVIMPSYTFVSTANAFLLRGAKIVFADSTSTNPNVDPLSIKSLVTAKTKAIVVVHYAGVACDMDPIMELASQHNLFVIEDAAQAIDSFYKGKPLGSIGHLAAFSFHETKNITSGEGGMLVINDERFLDRSEILWEKGPNRAAFSRREVKKYTWVDVGSSFLPSEMNAAFLYAQLKKIELIQRLRIQVWNWYFEKIGRLNTAYFTLPNVNDFATNNGHIFYLLARNIDERDSFISWMVNGGIQVVFHYIPLHSSPYYSSFNSVPNLPNADDFGRRLIRFPLYPHLPESSIDLIVDKLSKFNPA